MSFMLENNYLTDSKSNIEAICDAVYLTSKLLSIFDLFDEYIKELRIFETSKIIKDAFDTILKFSDGIFSESELKEHYTLTAYNNLVIFESLSSDDFASKALNLYFGSKKQIKVKSDSCTISKAGHIDNSKLNELYESLLSEHTSDFGVISSQGLQVFSKIRDEWNKRFELLINLLFFISTKSFGSDTNDTNSAQTSLEISSNIDGNTVSKRIPYSELIHSFILLNLVKHYLKLFENSTTSSIKGLASENGSFHNTQVLNGTFNVITHLKLTTSYTNNSGLREKFLDFINVRIKVINNAKAYIATVSKIFNDISSRNSLHSDENIDSAYIERTINFLIGNVFNDLLGNIPLDTSFLDGLKVIESFIEILNDHNINYRENNEWYKEYTVNIMDKFEESLLDYVRQLTINQYDSTTLMNPNTVNVYSDNEYALRSVDPKSVSEIIISILSETFEKNIPEKLLTRLNWLQGFGSLVVSKNMYLISIVVFRLSLMPSVIVHQLCGHDKIHPDVAEVYIEKNSKIIQNIVLLFVLLSLNTFKEFVHTIPKFLKENNDSKIPLSNFLVFLSNNSFFCDILPLIPYLVQDSFGLFSASTPELRSKFEELSHIIKKSYKMSVLRLALLKIKDYLVTQLTAFNQQCVQKILSTDIKSINNSFECHGDDLIDWIITFKANSSKYLPTPLYKTVFQLSIDLCYSSIINLVLDFFEKNSYKLPETSILRTRIYLDSIAYSLQEHVLLDCKDLNMEFLMENKFSQTINLFRYDYSVINSKEFEQLDLNRLTKLSKLIKSFDTS